MLGGEAPRRRRQGRPSPGGDRRARAPAPGVGSGSGSGSGTQPRARRTITGPPGSPRTTESSTRRTHVAVVEQEQVGDPAEPIERLAVAAADRLVGDVARGHDQRRRRQRRGAARRGAAWSAASGRGRRGPEPRPPRRRRSERRPASTTGARRTSAAAPRPSASSATSAAAVVEVARPSPRTAWSVAACARAAGRPTVGVVGATGELEAAQALDRDDLATGERSLAGRRGLACAAPARRPASPDPIRAATAAARTRGSRPARRGSGGRRGPVLARSSSGRAGSTPSTVRSRS